VGDLLESRTNILSEGKSIKIDEFSCSLVFVHFLGLGAVAFL
jgi:hypothetical protein